MGRATAKVAQMWLEFGRPSRKNAKKTEPSCWLPFGGQSCRARGDKFFFFGRSFSLFPMELEYSFSACHWPSGSLLAREKS